MIPLAQPVRFTSHITKRPPRCQFAFARVGQVTVGGPLECVMDGKSVAMSRTVEYATWMRMRHRCENPSNKRWNRYGGRGISVCAEWRHSFAAFFASVGPRPSPQHSLDRINNNGNYEPGNCRWATRSQQSSNKSDSTAITAFGRTATATEWSKITGLGRTMITRRVAAGVPHHIAVSEPPHKAGRPLPNDPIDAARAAATRIVREREVANAAK